MAAQKLTRGRFVQIIIMLTVLVAAFIWRTIEHDSVINVNCNTGERCAFFVNNSRFEVQVSTQNIQIKTDENDWVFVSKTGEIIPEIKNSTWLVKFTPESGAVSFNLTMKNENIDHPINIQID